MTPALIRESLTLSRAQRLPFHAAWEIATTEHPLEDFMEGYFNEGRDSEGKDFAEWLRKRWESAYESKPFSAKEKPTRLEPRNTYAEGLRSLPVASEGPSQGEYARGVANPEDRAGASNQTDVEASTWRGTGSTPVRPARVRTPGRCKSGDRCDRVGGHGVTGSFCEHHAGELARIRKVHGLAEAFDWDEFSSKTYQAAFG